MEILPESGQFYFIRISNYLLFGLQVYFTVSGFYNFYGDKIHVNKWSLMSVGFIISLLNFSPYPWPTTDGLLFSAIAFFLLSRNKLSITYIQLFAVSFFCMAAALTKQSFYFIPIIFTLWIYLSYGIKKCLAFIAGCLLIGIVFLLWIASITDLSVFIDLVTKETYLKGLLYAGLIDYLLIREKNYIYFIVLFGIVIFYIRFKNIDSKWLRLIKSTSISLAFTAVIVCLLYDFLIASRIAVISCLFGLLHAILIPFSFKKLQYYLPVTVSLGIAWCCSISMGYSYPILYATAIILSLLVLYENYFERETASRYLGILGVILSIVAFSYNYKPYRERNVTELAYRLDSVSPKLRYIYTNRSNFDKLSELKHLLEKYGPNFICAPNIPMAHYLFNTKSVLPADWIINTEINRNPGLFLKIASNPENYIFLEKSFLEREELMPEKKEDFSIITSYIHRNFIKIGETKYFIIYNSLARHEKFPEIN